MPGIIAPTRMTSIAAFIGISIALIGGEKWQSADDWAALFACALIAANGYRLLSARALRNSRHGSARTNCRSGAKRGASVPGVIEVEKCVRS